MAAYNIYEAKTRLSSLVAKALDGEEVIIAKAGKPVARMVPIKPSEGSAAKEIVYRKGGGSKGQFQDLLQELDKPWPEEVQRAFGMIE